ncbi:MAG: zf-HC2 domain-containing protein [Planctomycetes bacterium]|nr:zf-HC2 domain-containing protein [Planctomycetota bacterium]MBL7040927.1 zf-HC2 domain-containing protein [Pirellulaceae bacterium]
MNASRCDQLDDYFAGWLSETEASDFEAHLADCAVCRRQLDQQRRIDGLLAQAAGRLEPVPHGLVDRLESQIRCFSRRRTVRTAWGLSAAAAMVLLVGVWLHIRRPEGPQPAPKRQDEPMIVQQDVRPPAQDASDAEPLVQVRPSDPSAAILITEQTQNPNVTIVWFHPTVKPARRPNGADTN